MIPDQKEAVKLLALLNKKGNKMSYSYQTEREKLFTDEGQKLFLEIRDRANQLIKRAGCFHAVKAMDGSYGDSWTMIACLDRMVELGELREIERNTWGQYRIFEKPWKD